MNFEKFKAVNLTIGLPTMSVTTNGVTFSKAAIMKIGAPYYVKLLINEEDKQLGIIPCEKDEDDSTQFVKNKKNPMVRYNNKDFLNTIEKMMSWDLRTEGRKIDGEYFSEHNALVFDLNYSKTLTSKETDTDE